MYMIIFFQSRMGDCQLDDLLDMLDEEDEEREEKPQPADHWPPHHQLAPPQVLLPIYVKLPKIQ